MRTKFVFNRLEDEYTPNQLDPVADNDNTLPDPVEAARDVVDAYNAPDVDAESSSADEFDDLPVDVQQAMRLSVFETIVDEEITEIINENDGVINEDTIQADLEPVLNKAALLNKIPKHIAQRMVSRLVAKRFRAENEYVAFLSKLTHKLVDDMATVDEDEVIVDEVVEGTEPKESSSVAEEIVSDSPDSIVVDEDVPVDAAVSMRFLGASALNHRKATALAIKRAGSPVLRMVYKDMKNCIPRRVKNKYFSKY